MSKITQYRVQKKEGLKINLKMVNVIIFSLIIVSGVLYLINISDLTVKGFALKNLKSELAVVSDEFNSKQDQADSLQSYYSLNSRMKKLNMVAIGNVDYITVFDTVVAKR